MTDLGNLLLGLATLSSIVSVVALVWGHVIGEKRGEGATNAGYLATFGVAGLLTLAVLLILSAFMTENYTFLYVLENHTTDISNLRWLYQLSGVWAGREGSLLFWAWLLSIFIAYVAWRRLSVTDKLSNIALAVSGFIQLFFMAAMFIEVNNPFKVSPSQYFDAAGKLLPGGPSMNPLLQHWAMIIHPPTLFIGYAGLAIPFAFAVAALILGDGSKRWVELSNRITVFSWMFLGIGIGLGSVWAYVVLGWGGYWAWDPVENASLLPWLTGVGLVHSMTVYRRREGFKKWTVWMATVTFVVVLLGTFITRSGVIQSVHGFAPDSLSFWLFLLMMLGSLLVGGVGLILRSEEFRGREEFESMLSKESSYYFNNVLMFISALLVALMTLAPALKGVPFIGGRTFGAANYDLLARPIGILYVLIMAVCPILSWRHTDGETFWNRIKFPAIGGAVLGGLFMAIYALVLAPNYSQAATSNPMWDQVLAIAGLLVAALAIALPVWLFIDGARKRSESQGEGFGTALKNIMLKARTQSGGYLTHLGIGIILLGLIGSSMFVKDLTPTVKNQPGSKFEAAGYTFTFRELTDEKLANNDEVVTTTFDVARGGQRVKTMEPTIIFPQGDPNQRKLNVDIITEPLRDVFISFQGLDSAGNLSLNVKINPLITFVWIGFVLTILGSVLAVWPKSGTAKA